jgi:hypothetical protein
MNYSNPLMAAVIVDLMSQPPDIKAYIFPANCTDGYAQLLIILDKEARGFGHDALDSH